MSYTVDLEETESLVSKTIPDANEVRSIVTPSRRTPKSENRFSMMTDVGSTFLDFGKMPAEEPRRPRTGSPKNFNTTTSDDPAKNLTKSRFAAYTNAEVTYVKGIHDEIQSLTEEMAISSDYGPKFLSMDLARLISRLLVNLNLQPSKDPDQLPVQKQWLMNAEGVSSVPELKSTVTIQNVMLNELGKSMQKISKHNLEMVEMNKKLAAERNMAIQARDDLMKILLEEQDKHKDVSKNIKSVASASPKSLERQFFDEASIIDQAMETFRKMQRENLESNTELNTHTPIIQEKEEPFPHFEVPMFTAKEAIQFAADMISIRRQYEPASSLAVASPSKSK
jgi:hypothetical protein